MEPLVRQTCIQLMGILQNYRRDNVVVPLKSAIGAATCDIITMCKFKTLSMLHFSVVDTSSGVFQKAALQTLALKVSWLVLADDFAELSLTLMAFQPALAEMTTTLEHRTSIANSWMLSTWPWRLSKSKSISLDGSLAFSITSPCQSSLSSLATPPGH